MAQQVKLQWHNRLNHVSFDQLTTWMREGRIKVPHEVVVAPAPVCTACQFGKGRRRSHIQCTGPIDHGHDSPGEGVHFSRFIYLTLHQCKDAKEMVSSKNAFEAFTKRHGVSIRRIRADNGVYASQAFQASCDSQAQHLTLCGVGSHWQNGIAERCIGALQTSARTILLHAMSKWPNVVTEEFWPFALQHAANLYNHSPRAGATKTPWELFTEDPPLRHLRDYHVFGSPVYILHKALQDNPGSTSKWQSRYWQGVYLGHSSMHAGSVALVYNPATKHVTPQFHLTFDDLFSSIQPTPEGQQLTIDALLQRTAWLYKDDYAHPMEHHHFEQTPELPQPVAHLADPDTPGSTSQGLPASFPILRRKYHPVPHSATFAAWKVSQGISAEVFAVEPGPPSNASTSEGIDPSPDSEGDDHCPSSPQVSEGASFLTGVSPVAHSATTGPSPGDTLTQSAMLKAPDSAKFIKAQVPEIQNLHQSGVFSYHPIHTLPPRVKLLNAIWSYRRKRTPSGVFRKYKARICTDGSQQQYGVDYWETYAPVVSWSTVRLLLTMSSIHNWHSSQIDFTQAFTQPPIKEDVYMKIPQGWHVVDGALQPHSDPKHHDRAHYIKLEKSLYGIKQAARTWFHHLEPGLLKLGFKASAVDPCLFYRHDCILCLYVVDCLLFSPTSGVIQDVFAALCKDYLIGEEGSVQDFLGVTITPSPSGGMTFQQPALIQSILTDLNLIPCHPKPTPAISVLHPDHGGCFRTENWNYRSVIGKLNYLAQMTRPDISMAVHNCARFSIAPTYLHEQAVKRIGRYLFATQDKGLIYNPTESGTLDMYVDADFAGTWHKEFSHLRDCVLSRTGFVILYQGCPIHWGSKLQSEIALSTTEAEYIVLSMAARELIPLCRVLRELSLGSPLTNLLKHPPRQLPPSTIF